MTGAGTQCGLARPGLRCRPARRLPQRSPPPDQRTTVDAAQSEFAMNESQASNPQCRASLSPAGTASSRVRAGVAQCPARHHPSRPTHSGRPPGATPMPGVQLAQRAAQGWANPRPRCAAGQREPAKPGWQCGVLVRPAEPGPLRLSRIGNALCHPGATDPISSVRRPTPRRGRQSHPGWDHPAPEQPACHP